MLSTVGSRTRQSWPLAKGHKEDQAKTVGELRKVTAWPDNLVIATPQERNAASAIRVSKASHATRTTPKA
jgi:hypothetical protein